MGAKGLMPPLEDLTPLELKMAWLVADAGMDAAFESFSQEERLAALSMFDKVYRAYRQMPEAA
jgi:hypothetical protein